MNNYSQKKDITRQDIHLPVVYPVTGTLTNSNFDKLSETLIVHLIDSKLSGPCDISTSVPKSVPIDRHANLLAVREKLKTADQAVVFSRKTNTNYVNESKRICNRISLGRELVDQIKESIFPDVRNAMTKFVVNHMTDVLIDPTHCDILYYGPGGFFDEHRDTVPKFPYGNQHDNVRTAHTWRFYSVIVGLDSNTKGDEGSTFVYLPPRDFLVQCIDANGSGEADLRLDNFSGGHDRHMSRHIFGQSCRGGEFVAFSAEAIHGSLPVTHDDGFKMALKFDMWVLQPRVKFNYPPKYVACGCDDKDCWHVYTKPRIFQIAEKNKHAHRPHKNTMYFDSDDYNGEIDECNGYFE